METTNSKSIYSLPRYFVPSRQLFHLTAGKRYLIQYTEKGRQIKDDRGINRIVNPLPSEIEGETACN